MRRPLRFILHVLTVLSAVLAVAAAWLWVRSYLVSDRCGWATPRPDGPDRVLRSVDAWSAKGGVGVYVDEYRNAAFDRGIGSPWFHATDGSMHYPYVSAVAAGVAERRWTGGGFAVARATRGRDDLWVEMDGVKSATADAQVTTSVVLPWWSLALALSVLPIVRGYRRWRRGPRRLPGHCITCGYDLRATPDRCPECGTAR